MKKALSFCATMALSLSLGLSLGSCKDNDLADDGTNGGNGSEQNDALAQKYQSLQTLLGSMASVDSLPSNWNSATYTESPTIGVVKDEAEPHVRYVVTTSQAEANRLYRSYISKDVDETLTDDSWQMDGIGSLQFHLENSDNCYATLKVNVQQLPALEEIRFVSDEALGNNGLIAPSGCYYSFGDVVYQDLVDANGTHTPTFWVCVRPCSTSPNRRMSHWCSFQLVPSGDKNWQNFYPTDNNTFLPTHLSFDKSDAERHVQNFFNVLRIMANPDVAKSAKYKGIDDISKSNKDNNYATFKKLRNSSYMWDYLDLWNSEIEKEIYDEDYEKVIGHITGGVINKELRQNVSLKDVLAAKTTSINAFYYGYSKNYFSKGDFTVYDLNLSTTADYSPFLKVKKQTAYVNKADGVNFKDFYSGQLNNAVHFGSSAAHSDYQLIVKYRTGAELECTGASHSANDFDPAHTFEDRKSVNHITDVLVASDYLDYESYNSIYVVDEKDLLPFFCFGDEVKETSNFKGYQFCVRNADEKYYAIENNQIDYDGVRSWMKNILFIGYPEAKDKIGDEITPSDVDVIAALYEIAEANLIYNSEFKNYFGAKKNPSDEQLKNPYYQALKRLYENICKQYVGFGKETTRNRPTAQFEICAKNGTYYRFVYAYDENGEKYYYSLEKSAKAQLDNTPSLKLGFYNYYDNAPFNDTYSEDRTLYVKKKEERYDLKTSRAGDIIEVLENCKTTNK